MKKMNRRRFLQGMGSAAMLSGAPLMMAPNAGHAAFGDYRALVCVFLFGGNDGFNMLVPRSNSEYNVYANSRQNMAVAQADLLAINPTTASSVQYGVHPAMSGIRDLFEAGNAAFTANVGPLIEPTTKSQFFDKSVALPPQLFSHNDQQDQWHTLRGKAQVNTGWAGRLADALEPNAGAQMIATNSSLFGTSLFLAGTATTPYVMGQDGPLPFAGFDNSDPFQAQQRLAFERIVNAQYNNVYERAFTDVQKRAIQNADLVTNALALAPVINTLFPTSSLGQQLSTVAKLIAVRDQLQMERQIFFVGVGGFDTHDAQVQLQPGLLGDISASIAAFYNATSELGIAGDVTTFTQSDFGRTLTSNGDGTDHAWGSVQITVGGSVVGKDIYGNFPLLLINGPDDVGGGRMIPTTSADQYAATLAKWMGASAQELPNVAPNIGNFAQQDLGFMA